MEVLVVETLPFTVIVCTLLAMLVGVKVQDTIVHLYRRHVA